MITVDEYYGALDEPARTTLGNMRALIRTLVPAETTERMAYQMPTFHYNKKGLVGLAAFKDHCTLFMMNGSTVAAFAEDLKRYETSKGGVHFPLDKPLPAALVKKLVKARVAGNAGR